MTQEETAILERKIYLKEQLIELLEKEVERMKAKLRGEDDAA
jgi:hypothetical protein